MLEVSDVLMIFMLRPQRKAARCALEKIQSIQEWEKFSENSQRFIECATRIDTEMETEISKKEVMTSDLDMLNEDDNEEQEDSEDECMMKSLLSLMQVMTSK